MTATKGTTTPKKRAARRLRASQKDPLRFVEIEALHLYIQKDLTYAKVDEAVNQPAGFLQALLQRKPAQEYIKQYQAKFLDYMAELEAAKCVKEGVTREGVVARLMALAMLSPERTRGNVEGQIDALKEVSRIMGFQITSEDIAKMLGSMTTDQLRDMQPATPRPQ